MALRIKMTLRPTTNQLHATWRIDIDLFKKRKILCYIILYFVLFHVLNLFIGFALLYYLKQNIYFMFFLSILMCFALLYSIF